MKGPPFRRGRFEELPELPRVAHPYATAKSESITLDSKAFGKIAVRYVTAGEGPPLLLVHGLMTSSYSWRYMLEPLGKKYRLVIPDLPGAGGTDCAPDRVHSASALATFVGELQAALGIHGCLAVGNSLGGYLCMQRALQDGSSFSRLVVVHSPGIPEARLHALRGALAIPFLKPGLSWFIRRDVLRWTHKNVHYYDESLKSLEEARAYGEPLARAGGAESLVRYLGEAVNPRELGVFVRTLAERRERGEPFPMPLLLLYAREDPMVPPSVGPKLAALIPDAELTWMEATSHFAHVDSPDRVAPLLLDFLGGSASASRP